MSNLVVMHNPETGRCADVPKSQIELWLGWGWRIWVMPKESEKGPLVVAKGPRGKLYVKQDGKIMSDPFDTEDEAKAQIETLSEPKE